MPELKLKLKDPGAIHLMALDTSSEFLPFGCPLSDYLGGVEGNKNGSRALLNQGPIAFSPSVRYESLGALLKTTGFGGAFEQEEVAEPEAAPAEPDPAVADFLPFEWPSIIASEEDAPPKVAPAMALEDLPVSIPRVAALPLRPRMTFGPPPAPKVKPPQATPPKPAAPTPVAKAAPVVAPPPKPAPPAPPKSAAPNVAPKPAAPAPIQAKPAAPVPPAPKASPAPPPRVNVPQAPVARTPEPAPAPPKPAPTPTRVAVARTAENIATADAPKPSTQAPPQARTPAPAASPKPPVPADRTPTPVEQAPAREVIARETPKAKEPEPPKKSAPVETTPIPDFSPNLGSAEQIGFFEKIPMVAKIGAAVVILAGGLYFTMGGKSTEKPAESSGSTAVVVGEQGWSTEWASDTGGSKRARQLTMYRPSVGMSDYQLQFVGQIETKALGWIFRAFDTKNYYAMKIESIRPGTMGLTHFAVVDGRESSYSQKPLTIDARPGAAYRIKLDVSGPRFTVSIGGEPVDFWTDNRLKVGSVGFMNEREERGAASSVQFSFPKVSK